MIREWWRSRKARYAADEAKALAESRCQARLTELASQPHKSMSDLLELKQLMEGAYDPLFGPARMDWLKADLGRMLDFNRGGLGTGGWTSKQGAKGAQPPLYRSEGELCILRDASRIITADYPKADGMIRNIAGYVLGDGATVQARPRTDGDKELAKLAQRVIDEFADRIQWEIVQEEFFFTSRRDGDAWLRTFAQEDGRTDIRTIWPEQIRWPHGEDAETFGYGVETPADDTQTVTGYAVFPTDSTDDEDFEYVPADEMVGIKCNVDAGVRRGIPDLSFGMLEVMKASQKLANNMGAASAQQASIAFIRQHTGAPKATIEAFRNADADWQKPNVFTGTDIQVKEAIPGQIIDTNNFTEFKDSPYSGGIAGHIEVSKLLDRTSSVKYGAPEWVVNADASSNSFANALSQEAPFLIRIKSFQRRYTRPFRSLFETVIKNAVKASILPPDTLKRIEVKVTMPSPMIRDRNAEAQAGDLRLKNGTLSPQTFCEQQGDEWDKERRNIKQATADGWSPAAAAPMLGKPGQPGPNGTPQPSMNGNGKPQAPRPQPQPQQDAMREMLERIADRFNTPPPAPVVNVEPPIINLPEFKMPEPPKSAANAYLEEMRASLDRSKAEVAAIIAGIPAPVVNVPAPIVNFPEPPDVPQIDLGPLVEAMRDASRPIIQLPQLPDVHLPEITIHAPPPDPILRDLVVAVKDLAAREPATPQVTVNVPKQPAPQVNVEVAPAEVVLEMPPRQVTIERDKDGKITGAEVTGG